MPRKICLMGRLDKYNVELKGLTESNSAYNWTVDQEFFNIVEGQEVQRGKVPSRFFGGRHSYRNL